MTSYRRPIDPLLATHDAPCDVCSESTPYVCADCGGRVCPRCACPHKGPSWADRTRRLLDRAIDVEDTAVVDAAAILAAGHGVRFVFTIRNGHYVDVRAERVDYDGKGRIR